MIEEKFSVLEAEVVAEYSRQEGITTPDGYKYSASSIIDASKVVVREVEWLWYPYLPKGMMVMGEGESELGKTAVELDLLARMTRGDTLPDGSKIAPVGVVYVTFEDMPEYTLVPRLIKAHADLSKVRIIANVSNGDERVRPLNIDLASDLEAVRKGLRSYFEPSA